MMFRDNKKDRGALQRVAILEEETSLQRAELARRAEILLVYEEEIDALTRTVADLSADRQEVREKLRAAEIETDRRQAENDAALARAVAELERVMQSRSLRLTAPLRRFRGYLLRR